jgi:hypothetical protein
MQAARRATKTGGIASLLPTDEPPAGGETPRGVWDANKGIAVYTDEKDEMTPREAARQSLLGLALSIIIYVVPNFIYWVWNG